MPDATAATGRLTVDRLTVDNTVNPVSTDNPCPPSAGNSVLRSTTSANRRTGDLAWDDFTLDIDFTIKAAAASVVFRAKDTANFYLWQLNAAVTPGKILLRPHVKVDGGFTNLGEIELSGFDAAARHHLLIRAEGSTITTWIDGSQVNQLTNTALSKGTVGFRSSTTGGVQERAAYDNLVVHSLSGEELYRDDFTSAPNGQLEPTGDPTLIQRDPEARCCAATSRSTRASPRPARMSTGSASTSSA